MTEKGVYFDCLECGKRVASDERHTYDDCRVLGTSLEAQLTDERHLNDLLKERIEALEVELRMFHAVMGRFAKVESDTEIKASIERMVAHSQKVLQGGAE